MIRVHVKLFGAFRKFAVPGVQAEEQTQAIILELAQPTAVNELREHLALKLASLGTGFNDRGLIAESAFADENSVLEDQTVISGDTVLAILPPVCGG